ncbi:hypothetical protein TELCIR_26303, partial [Teladorsagia circumcincta]
MLSNVDINEELGDLSDGIIAFCISLLISGALVWFVLVQLIRLSIKLLLSYKGWMYEAPGKPISKPTKLWLHLRSMRPILNDEEFAELEHLSEVFRKGVGRRLQRYLQLKSWLSTNYDTLNEHPTHNQGARAANVTYCALQFRRQVERQEVSP